MYRQPQQNQYRRPGPIHHAPPPPPQQQQQPQMTPQQAEQSRQEQIRRHDLARRQSKKPTDREIPEELADVIVGDGVDRYKKLREAERRLDALMMRKRLDMNDDLQRQHTRREGVLRVWISNTAEGQHWQVAEEGGVGFGEDGTFDFGENSQATFRVKIEGRLLPASKLDSEVTEEDQKEEEAAAKPKFSQFFKSITVKFDRNAALQSDGYSAIEWQKPLPNTPGYNPNSNEVGFDKLEFERKGDENMNVTIELVRDVKSEAFKLSPQLAEILDMEETDKAGAVQGIWEYCRAMGLQEDEEKRNMICDEPLRRLFQKDHIYFPMLPALLNPHLRPLDPITLSYTIRVDQAYINGTPELPACAPTVYDLHVPLPNPINASIYKTHTSDKEHKEQLQSIIRTDEDLALLVQKIHNTNAKRKFYENLAKDPANFVRRWFESQTRDREVVLAEGLRGGGEEEYYARGTKEGVWRSQAANESVGLWLARNTKAH